MKTIKSGGRVKKTKKKSAYVGGKYRRENKGHTVKKIRKYVYQWKIDAGDKPRATC